MISSTLPGNGETAMLKYQGFLILVCAALLFILRSPSVASTAGKDAKKDDGKVAGILIDKNDNWITVKADGEDEPVTAWPGSV